MSVKRPANSLVLMIPANEVNCENAIEDMLNYCETDAEDVCKRRTESTSYISRL